MTTEDSNSNSYAPGWYPNANQPGTEQYYDGQQWTDQVRTLEGVPMAPAAPGAPAAKSAKNAGTPRPWFKKKRIMIPAIVGGIIVISTAVNGGNGGDTTAEPAGGASSVAQDAEAVAAEEAPTLDVPDVVGKSVGDARAAAEGAGLGFDAGASGDDWTVTSQNVPSGEVEDTGGVVLVVAAEQPEPEMTLGQENAIDSAESYLGYMAFSRAGLIGQLTSEYGEGFDPADAEFAVAYLESRGLVDWNAEAVESAESYLEHMAFSRAGLYDQLTSAYGEEFTPEQAEHALGVVGY